MKRDGRTPWLRLGWFLLVPWLLPAPDAMANEEPPASEPAAEETKLVVEDAYLQIMLAWADGSETAVAELSELQQRLAEHIVETWDNLDSIGRLPTRPPSRRSTPTGPAEPGLACLRRIQHFIHTRIAGLDPEILLPLADFHRQLYAEHMRFDAFRPSLAEHSEARAFWLIDFYREVAEPAVDEGAFPPLGDDVAFAPLRGDLRSRVVGLLIAMAETLSATRVEHAEATARKVFGRVLRLDPENFAARYWAAFLAERGGDYGDAVRHLVRLEGSPRRGAGVTSSPEDVEVALRLAINRARTGRAEAAIGALESIARGDDPDSEWLRILAYQELGRLHAGKRPQLATAALREGARRFPGNSRLRLQLSYLLREDWRTALDEVRRVENEWRGDTGISPRVLYLRPRRDEIDAELARHAREVERRKENLARGLERVFEHPRWRLPRFTECPEYISLADPSLADPSLADPSLGNP